MHNRFFDRLTPSAHEDDLVIQPRVTKDELERAALASPEAAKIVKQINGLSWYHTLDLGHGVRTPGFVDHRPQLDYYDLPASMAGLRVLDVATFDGFWAFEFERRGADEVLALDVAKKSDIDAPRWMLRDLDGFGLTGTMGESFSVARKILKSKVKRIESTVYELSPETFGMFDIVFISDLLVHLRDPQLALERAYGVCKPGGQLVLADVYAPQLDGISEPLMKLSAPSETWWYPNVACLRQMMTVAGFEQITETSRFRLDAFEASNIHKVVLKGTAAVEPRWAVRVREERVRRQQSRDAVWRS